MTGSAAEAGRCGPVPIGLILGNIYRGGTRPRFNPERLTSTLLHLLEQPDADNGAITSEIEGGATPAETSGERIARPGDRRRGAATEGRAVL